MLTQTINDHQWKYVALLVFPVEALEHLACRFSDWSKIKSIKDDSLWFVFISLLCLFYKNCMWVMIFDEWSKGFYSYTNTLKVWLNKQDIHCKPDQEKNLLEKWKSGEQIPTRCFDVHVYMDSGSKIVFLSVIILQLPRREFDQLFKVMLNLRTWLCSNRKCSF